MITCWDGSTAISQELCPKQPAFTEIQFYKCPDGSYVATEDDCAEPGYICWDGKAALNEDYCTEFECNYDTYFLLEPCDNGERDFFNCTCPWRQCPDDTWVAELSDCRSESPPDVVCWDGSVVYTLFDCPLPDIFSEEPLPDVGCWNGEFVFDEADCDPEPLVECWNN